MSLNTDHGKTLTYDKSNNTEVYYDEEDDDGEQWIESDHFELIPNVELERDVILINGSSGKGKSTLAKNYALNYRLLFPKNNIFMFSQFPANYDKAYMYAFNEKTHKNDGKDIRKILNIRFVELNKEFMNKKIDIVKDIHDALIIFDDFEDIDDEDMEDIEEKDEEVEYDDYGEEKKKKTKKRGKGDTIVNKINKVIRQVLKLGRKNNISALILGHVLYGETGQTALFRVEMTEAHRLVFFKDDNEFQIRRALNTRFGLDQRTISNIFDIKKSRWR